MHGQPLPVFPFPHHNCSNWTGMFHTLMIGTARLLLNTRPQHNQFSSLTTSATFRPCNSTTWGMLHVMVIDLPSAIGNQQRHWWARIRAVGTVDEGVEYTVRSFEVEQFLHSFCLFKTNFNVVITVLKYGTWRGIAVLKVKWVYVNSVQLINKSQFCVPKKKTPWP